MSDLSKLKLGTAPDSWGVWFPSDPYQVTWEVYLDDPITTPAAELRSTASTRGEPSSV